MSSAGVGSRASGVGDDDASRSPTTDNRQPTTCGTFYDWNPDRARILNELIATVHEGTLVVIPEGISINYLTRTRTQLTFHTFTPVETADAEVETTTLASPSLTPPTTLRW